MEDNKGQYQEENSEQSILTDNDAGENSAPADEHNAAEENELQKLKEELEEQKDKYLRLFAEFDNFKRRNAKERIELLQTAAKEVITSMLDVLDDVDRAEKQIQQTEDVGQIKEGVTLVFNKLKNILQSKGLKAMDSIGEDFNVEKHEAITGVPVEDDSQKGKIIDEVQKGYYLNEKLIRFAKVVVGN